MEQWNPDDEGQEVSLLDLPEGSDPWIAWLNSRPRAAGKADRPLGRIDRGTLIIGAAALCFWGFIGAALWITLR